MPKYERIEWTNIWIEHQGETDRRRILLIGDSITQASTDYVKRCVGDEVRVDALTTSHAVDNEALETELFYMLGLGEYDAIHFNNGLHGLHLPVEEYEENYDRLIGKILEKCPKAKMILGLSTPLTKLGSTDVLDDRNSIVIERNEAVLRIAEKYNLEVNDNYSAVFGNAGIRATDSYHYNAEGYRLIGNRIGNLLKA